jgi:hypothetical protein
MHKYAILRVFVALGLVATAVACQPTQSDLEVAIRAFYERSNRMEGGGNFSISNINIIEHNRDADMVLADVTGAYVNRSLPNETEPKRQVERIWFLYKRSKGRVEVVKIATPEQIEKELLQKY